MLAACEGHGAWERRDTLHQHIPVDLMAHSRRWARQERRRRARLPSHPGIERQRQCTHRSMAASVRQSEAPKQNPFILLYESLRFLFLITLELD
eukprot:scaffold24742_cov123-Isochrysis_galbana.AAC.6